MQVLAAKNKQKRPVGPKLWAAAKLGHYPEIRECGDTASTPILIYASEPVGASVTAIRNLVVYKIPNEGLAPLMSALKFLGFVGLKYNDSLVLSEPMYE